MTIDSIDPNLRVWTAYAADSGEIQLGVAADYTIEAVPFSELRVGDSVAVMWGELGVYIALVTSHHGDYAIAEDCNADDLDLMSSMDDSPEWRFIRR
ncbi:hypothetical protein [Nocardia acidivorans]|uniref:hypothetical protein n=1 Tax=Nocardia acidivorans TaxID=404580 RepID=UPI000830BD12|nr:hypothetical protein [Nocardia acidivorans]